MHAIRLYGRYIGASLRSQMQYPASFLLTSVGAFAATGVDFIATWALFARFRQVAGWRFGEVALFYAVIGSAFALADALTRGFDVFGEQLVKTGDFDRLLVRPRSTVLQLATPDEMRGRVSSVNSIFISSSNELGAFYSGAMARLLGLVPSVVLGGFVTMGVVGVTAWKAPKLRKLDLRDLQ